MRGNKENNSINVDWVTGSRKLVCPYRTHSIRVRCSQCGELKCVKRLYLPKKQIWSLCFCLRFC